MGKNDKEDWLWCASAVLFTASFMAMVIVPASHPYWVATLTATLVSGVGLVILGAALKQNSS